MILPGLVRLALVRSLRPALCVLWLALLAWVLATSELGANELLDAGEAARTRWEHGSLRSAAWSLCALVLCAWLALQAARTLPAWRRRDVDWLAPRGAPALPLVASSWAGIMLAALVLAVATGLCVEVPAARGGAGTWIEGVPAFDGGEGWVTHEHESVLALSPEIGALPRGALLHLEFSFAGPGSRAAVEAWITRADAADELARTRKSISAVGALELELPELRGGERVHLLLPDKEARMFHDAGAARLWIPTAHESLASLTTLALLLLGLAGWTGLALGLGGWLGTGTATFALLGLLATALLSGFGESWLPLARLGGVLEVLEQGRVPRWPAPGECAGALVFACTGIALAWSSLRRWRRER